MIRQWFEDWFDSPLYEQLYAHRDHDDALQLAHLIAEHCPPTRYPSMLDLACGRGRHSLNFARMGYTLTGVDLSPNAIQKASNHAKSEHLEITFSIGDMRQALPETFDLIVNLFTSFGYFEADDENEAVIRSLSQMIKPKGVIWIDFLNSHYVRQHLKPRDEGHLPDWNYWIKRWIDGDAIHKEIHLIQPSSGDEQLFREYVRLYDIAWFTQVLAKYDVKILAAFGDYAGTPFKEASSPRLLMKIGRNSGSFDIHQSTAGSTH